MQEFNTQPELVKGRNGVFDVAADGVVVFSKDRAGRFPDAGEVVKTLRTRQTGS